MPLTPTFDVGDRAELSVPVNTFDHAELAETVHAFEPLSKVTIKHVQWLPDRDHRTSATELQVSRACEPSPRSLYRVSIRRKRFPGTETLVLIRLHPILLALLLLSCGSAAEPETRAAFVEVGPPSALRLPPPYATPSAQNRSKAIGWPQGRIPRAPAGFAVRLFADDLDNPRWIYVLPNGDVLAAESIRESPNRPADRSANRISLFRDTNKDGQPDRRETFLSGLNLPFGMLLLGGWFYVANTDALVRYPYKTGQTRIETQGEKILDLPAGGHYTRNVIADPSGRKLYVAVGSTGNVDEDKRDAKDPRRAAILEINPDGSGMRVFAGGLRNPVGMDWEPKTNVLWTVVNERDGLGDQLVPDYLTSVKEGAFYGWPYSYFGQNEDPRKKGERPDLVAKAIPPDYALGSHVAALGLAFYRGQSFPARYRGGAFIGMHGSWNRSNLVGYKVAFLRFENGRPAGTLEDFLTGFIADERTAEVYGRPVGVTVLPDGSLLVADDWGKKLWRVTATR
ncbi:MAG TPA: sorbosone dehydrogenase family protein [Candidatus Eisenbacteria bacterium]|nr:sorbosone dehydrogenase family protein [Candidatus Eisenbacteria bacterium]